MNDQFIDEDKITDPLIIALIEKFGEACEIIALTDVIGLYTPEALNTMTANSNITIKDLQFFITAAKESVAIMNAADEKEEVPHVKH